MQNIIAQAMSGRFTPMYDFAHPIEDAIERVTHSICTLEFEVHRPLYDWVCREWDDTEIPPNKLEFCSFKCN